MEIVLLTRAGAAADVGWAALSRQFDVRAVVYEGPPGRVGFVRRRIRRLGARRVAGQVLFRVLAVPLLTLAARARLAELARDLGAAAIPEELVTRVDSVNDEETKELLRRTNPDAVVVLGTRIIHDDVLASIPAPFVNVHAGVTPLYRGAHGAYWALVARDAEHCGVTVHLVDSGVDTGGILGQARIDPGRRDSIVTYPLLQLGAALPLLVESLESLGRGEVAVKPPPDGPSRVQSHPTLGEYLQHRLAVGVK